MLLKLTNMNGGAFLMNDAFILEAEPREEGDAKTVLFVANGREYLVQETIDQIAKLSSSTTKKR
jgi:uncharacterized protein YlzI (FlbEa/FlbD family)